MIDTVNNLLGHWSHSVFVILVFVAALVANLVIHWVLAALIRRASLTRHPWRHALLDAPDAPLRVLVWLIAVVVVVDVLNAEYHWEALEKLFPPLRDVLAIGIFTWWLIRLVNRAKANLESRANSRGEMLDPTAVDAICKLCWIVIFITAVLVMMQTLGFSIAGLLAFGGAAGIAVGFAAQSLVANLLGGLTIFASRIFKIGDYIILPGTELMGGVEHIGWRATRVLGFDCKPFYVPNSVFNTTTVINHSRMTNRRISEYVHLRYQDVDRTSAIVREVNSMIENHPDIDHSFYVFRFDSYGDFALKLFLYAFTVSTDYTEYMRVKEDMLLTIADIIRKQGGELAIPISNVQVPDGLRLLPAADPVGESLTPPPQRP